MNWVLKFSTYNFQEREDKRKQIKENENNEESEESEETVVDDEDVSSIP